MINKHIALLLVILIALLSLRVKANQSLEQLRWEYRVLLLPVIDESHLGALQRQFSPAQEDSLARRLLTIVVTADNVFSSQSVDIPRQELMQILALRPNHAVLIGLDGEIKGFYPMDRFSLDAVFADIDLMPMRRRELQQVI